MNIAYISADFGVHIFGYKGASIHVREMVTAWCKAGQAVCIISPAIGTKEGDNLGVGASQSACKRDNKENFPGLPLAHFSTSPFSLPDTARLSFLPLQPRETHVAVFRELEKADKFMGVKTRVRHELRNALYNLVLFEALRDELKTWPVDLIYERYALFSNAGVRLAKELGVPHILEVNAPLADEQEKMRGLEMKNLAHEMERRIWGEANAVVVVSRPLRDFAVSRGVPAARIHVLPNAVDPQRFIGAKNGAMIRAQHRLEGKRVIGFVGSLKPWHGTETLLTAFRELHAAAAQTHLLIVGDGPGREDLEKYARANGLNGAVTFTGNVPYDDIPNYIAAMDITVAPYKPQENFYYSPIKIFEYMIMGKPVIAGKIGQVEEVIVDSETGVLFEPGNIAQLTAALAALVNDAPLCHRLGEQARVWVQQERTWDNNARRAIEIAESLR
jgi:glycosyltransferase involved in cell wall biosynthesis